MLLLTKSTLELMVRNLLVMLFWALAFAFPSSANCTVNIKIVGNADSIEYFNEEQGEVVHTCIPESGNVDLTFNRNSDVIRSLLVNYHEENSENSQIVKFYIVPDSKRIKVTVDVFRISISGSERSSAINNVMMAYYRHMAKEITDDEAIHQVYTEFLKHSNDIVGIQAIMVSFSFDMDLFHFVDMYNHGGRSIKTSSTVNNSWSWFNKELYEAKQPIVLSYNRNYGKRYRFRKIAPNKCISILKHYPDDYELVWKALGNLHLFYPERSLPYEVSFAMNRGNAIACTYLLQSFPYRVPLDSGKTVISRDFPQLPDIDFQTFFAALKKCANQNADDFGKAACCDALAEIYSMHENFDKDSVAFYSQKSNDMRSKIASPTTEIVLPEINRSKKKYHSDINSQADAVDLGLSVKWGKYNLGACDMANCGDYYSWGEIRPKRDSVTSDSTTLWDPSRWESYKWYDSNNGTLVKYRPIILGDYLSITDCDCLEELQEQDDAAHVALGNGWRMPTAAEWNELCNPGNCLWEWIDHDDLHGYKVTSIKNGYEGNYIFLPVTEHITRNDKFYGARYWTSSLECDLCAYSMTLSPKTKGLGGFMRYLKYPIRPVYEK